jgi:MFS family permease
MSQASVLRQDAMTSEWRNGWPLILSCTFGIGVVAIPTYTIGLFVEPLSAEYGWTISAIVFAQTLLALANAPLSPVAGMAMDRFGARPLVLTGALFHAIIFSLLAFNGGSLWLFYALWLLLAVATTATSPMIWLKAVVDRFEKNRGFASSVALCGSNIAGAITPLLAAWLIIEHGWRAAYFGLALYMLVTALPLALIFYHDKRSLVSRAARKSKQPSTTKPEADMPGLLLKEARMTREFWVLLASFFFAGAGITGFIVHAVPMLTSQGVSTIMAASAVTTFSISAIAGRVGAGWLMDRIFAPRLAAVALAIPVGAMALLLGAPSYPVALLAAAMVGISTGAEYNMISYLTANYFGFKRYGTISGWMNTTFTLGCTGGPLLAAWMVTATGSYDTTIIMLGASFGLASVIMLLCRSYDTVLHADAAES